MAADEGGFSIHHDDWEMIWHAATATVKDKERKKLVDLNIQERVSRLLGEYGPSSAKPLSLRIFGTMIKGFCVINNDRARILFTDCERLVAVFAQTPSLEEASRVQLPKKRQRVDVTLDLSLAQLQHTEELDWSLERLQLTTEELPGEVLMPELGEGLEPPLLTPDMLMTPLLDLPALEMPAEVPPAMAPPEEAPAPSVYPGPLEITIKRRPRRKREEQPLQPGVVYGYDESIELSQEEIAAWYRPDPPLRHPTLAELVSSLPPRVVSRQGPLLELLFDPSEVERQAEAQARLQAHVPPPPPPDAPEGGEPDFGGEDDFPPMEELLSAGLEDPMQPEMLTGIFAEPPEGPAFDLVAAEVAAFRGSQEYSTEVPYDVRTAQVGALLQQMLTGGSTVTFAMMSPPSRTDRATAARTFSSVLSLATAGKVGVQQSAPYGPIQLLAVL